MIKNIRQVHNGTGDNIAGDKKLITQLPIKKKSIPIWAQWTSWIFGIILTIWTIYEFIK